MSTTREIIYQPADFERALTWDNGADREPVCRLFKVSGAYCLHRGSLPNAGEVIQVFQVPLSVGALLRRVAQVHGVRMFGDPLPHGSLEEYARDLEQYQYDASPPQQGGAP